MSRPGARVVQRCDAAIVAHGSPAPTRRATRSKTPSAMQNDEGRIVDLYLPRKCSATNRLIPAKEHSAVQLNIGQAAGGHDGGVHGAFTTA